MKKYTTWISLIAVIISFAGGFLLANALNKAELDKAKAENSRLMNNAANPAGNPDEADLSMDEIKQKIAEAEQNAGNAAYQKNLGIALYKYASMKKMPELLPDAEKLLMRANQLDPKDTDVLFALGNLNFDLGFRAKDNSRFEKARGIYQKLLDKTPEDYAVRTDLALTYYLKTPPDYEAAIAELNKSLKIKADNEKALQFLVQAYLRAGKKQEAETTLAKLKTIDPNTPALSEIATQMEQTESNGKQ